MSQTIRVEHKQWKKNVRIVFILCFSVCWPQNVVVWLDAVLLLAEQFCHLIHVQFVAIGIAWLPVILCH